MRRTTDKIFTPKDLRTPQVWTKPNVVTASLLINLLGLALPLVILQVYDRIIPNLALNTFAFLIFGLVCVVVFDTGLRILRSLVLGWEGARFDHIQSLRTMNRILDAKTAEFEANSSGYYLDKMRALEKIQEFYSGQSMLLMLDFPFAIVYLSLIWLIAGNLVLIPIGLLATFLLASAFAGRRLLDALHHRAEMEDRRENFIIEMLRGVHTIKSMAMERFMQRRYEKLQAQSAKSIYELSRINSIVQGVGASFSQMAVVAFASIGCFAVIDERLSVGALAAGTMLSSRVLQPGLRAMGLWTQFQSVRLAHQKAADLFAIAPEQDGDFQQEERMRGGVEIQQLCFRYPTQDKALIRDLSLTIKPGEAIGITGNNGVGKSTLVQIIAGFLEPTDGAVHLDGRPIGNYDLEYLRRQIGIVPQSGTLFEGTLLENMTLYREGSAIADALELAHDLGLEEIISRLPEGLDTKIGGTSVDKLAEGARQKIIMVRALVGSPSIVLFDDANANFDIKNDTKLMHHIEKMKGDRTLIIVSHRPSFLRLCDRCFSLTDGKLEELEPTYTKKNIDKPRASVQIQQVAANG